MSPYVPKTDDETRRLAEAYAHRSPVQLWGWPMPCRVLGLIPGFPSRYLLEVDRRPRTR